jgi:flagellar biosynthesis/type III secretory pathway chaperone
MHAEGMPHALQSVLTQEVECTERLLESLKTERSALAQRDMSALAGSTERKLALTQRLETLEEEREQLLAGMGFTGQASDLTAYLATHAGVADKLLDLWQRVLGNTEACRRANLTNGGILEASRQNVEQTLRILRGQTGSPSLYDPNGETAPHLGQRELGKV